MLTKIIVYGKLRKLLGRKEFEAKLQNAKQVFNFLTANYPQVSEKILRMTYAIKLNNKFLNNLDIENPIGNKILRLVPVAFGSSNSFFIPDEPLFGNDYADFPSYNIDYNYTPSQSDFTSNFEYSFGSDPGSSSQSSAGNKFLDFATNLAVSYAASQLENQVQNFLQPQPEPINIAKAPTAVKDKSFNASFNGISNTINAGIAVPICLGETYTGSIVISAALDTVQFTGKGKEVT